MPKRTPEEREEFRQRWDAEQREFAAIKSAFDRLLLVLVAMPIIALLVSAPYARIWHSIREMPRHPCNIHCMMDSLGKDLIARAETGVQVDR